jgi:hypothetical protein
VNEYGMLTPGEVVFGRERVMRENNVDEPNGNTLPAWKCQNETLCATIIS